MAKPSERNRMMRDIAGVAMDEELTALRRKRADLARLAVQLDDMRWAAERFREQAEAFCREYAEPRSYITGALGMAPRETGMAFHAVAPDYARDGEAAHGSPASNPQWQESMDAHPFGYTQDQ